MIVSAEKFFATVQPGQRFRLIDPSGMSIAPGPDDILTAAGPQPDEECGVLHMHHYSDGTVGGFDAADMQAKDMQFELIDEEN